VDLALPPRKRRRAFSRWNRAVDQGRELGRFILISSTDVLLADST
jgi:hypothetical protein